MEKQIQRDFYLNQLIANKDRSVCKVVTGMRRLTCPKCGHRGWCVEVYAENAEKDGANNV